MADGDNGWFAGTVGWFLTGWFTGNEGTGLTWIEREPETATYTERSVG